MSRMIRLVAAVIAMIQIANLQYAWTQFVEPLKDAHGWNLSEVQWAFSIFIALETWAMPLTGWLIDSRGARVLMTVAGILCGIGWTALGYVDSLPALYFFYALAGLGAAIVYCGSIGVALKWFPDRRGFAAGIIAAGFGAGSAIYAEPVRYVLRTQDYSNAFLYTGLIQGLLIIVAAQFLGGAGRAKAPAASAAKQPNTRTQKDDFNSAEMLRSMHFYWLYAMMLMMGIGGLLATAQVSQVASHLRHCQWRSGCFAHLEPNRQRQWTHLLGLGIGQGGPRRGHADFVLHPGAGVDRRDDHRGAVIDAVRHHHGARVLHLGPSVRAVPVDLGRFLRLQERELELQLPLLDQGRRGADCGWLGRGGV